jgi:diguanylate cyclase (GGDEF)-like protein
VGNAEGVEAASRSHRLVQGAPDPVWFVDPSGVLMAANAAATALFELDDLDATDGPVRLHYSPASHVLLQVEADATLRAGQTWRGEVTVVVGAVRIPLAVSFVPGFEDGELAWFGVCGHDLRPQRHRESELRRLATHDELTGLANRSGFIESGEVTVARGGCSLVLFDLDHLKVVNDTLGHAAGDQLLVEVGERIRGELREHDTAARLGGDEFAVLLPDTSQERAVGVAQRLLASLARPYTIAGRPVHATASIGVAASDLAGDLLRLLQHADVTMYLAKQAGRDRIEVYGEEAHRRLSEVLRLQQDLDGALADGQFRLDYQPIVSFERGALGAVEALLRWDHPELGAVAPPTFVPLLEESGDIVEVGAWVITTAVQQLAAWDRDGLVGPGVTMSVNVSAHQLADDTLVDGVRDVLTRTGIDPVRLTLELTESAMVRDLDGAVAVLQRLRDIGVRVALDDFGTGFSALGSLASLPIDQLKIDRSFVTALHEVGDPTLVASICRMASSLGLTTVAEGIEHPAQAATLRGLDCDAGQGYLWSKPVGPERIPDLARGIAELMLATSPAPHTPPS